MHPLLCSNPMQKSSRASGSPHHDVSDDALACVEVGGGSIQTVLFSNGTPARIIDGAHQPASARVAVAVPGLIQEGVVLWASNLGWRDTDPVTHLGLKGPAELVLNDAEAAALGEAVLRGADALSNLVYMCIGTGVGGAVVEEGRVVRANLFGHNAPGYGTRFGDAPCRCERVGCLETVAAGWALPNPLSNAHLRIVAPALAEAVEAEPLAADGPIVLGGGIARRYPKLVELIADELPHRHIEPSLVPHDAKSAAAWGLRHALQNR